MDARLATRTNIAVPTPMLDEPAIQRWLVTRVQEFQTAFLQYVDTSGGTLRQDLASKPELTEDIEDRLKQALADFKAKVWKK